MAAAEDAARRPEIPRRCHHCAGPLSKDMETSSWTVPPLVRDSFSMIGSAVGGTAGAFYGFNHAMPVVQRFIKGPMWMHFLVGAPPVIIFSSACAGLAGLWLVGRNLGLGLSAIALNGSSVSPNASISSEYSRSLVLINAEGGTIPAFAQLVSSSYHAAVSSPTFARSASHAAMPSPSFPHSASHDDMHKRSSSPL
ncbi:hypothetical protein ACP4OV_020549 [Aristida adscensionis]